MRLRLFNFFAGISLVLCLGTAVLWTHSYRAYDQLFISHISATAGIDPEGQSAWHCVERGVSGEANHGRLAISYDVVDEWLSTRQTNLGRGFHFGGWSDRSRADGLAGHPWFEWTDTFDGSEVGGEAAMIFPLPLLLVLTAILPAIALRRVIRKRGVAESSCRVCGYDLRATPGRCPECGEGYTIDLR